MQKTKQKKELTTAEIVDQLGQVKAELANWKEEETHLVAQLKAKGVAIYQGDLFEANVFESSSSKLDKDQLCKKHKLMSKWLEACTTTTDTTVCKVTARVQR